MMSIYKNIIIFIIIGLCVFLLFWDFSYLKLNTADSSIYLSTAENIANHKGFAVSYNLCQSFNTLYHPLFAYYQPLYSLFASFFINHGGIVRVIQMNILLLAFNAALVYVLLESFMPAILNILFIFFLLFSTNFFITAIYPWTEQFHFFCFISGMVLFLKNDKSSSQLFYLGALNGIFILVRVAHMYNFLAYLPIILIGEGNWRWRIERFFMFAGGFVLFYGIYQLFCFCTYHAFYPEYARPGAAYGIAHFSQGIIYLDHQAGIKLSPGPLFSPQSFLNIGHHLRDFYRQMPLFLWPALIYGLFAVAKRQESRLVALCIFQCIFTIAGYSATFYWLPIHFESLRYSIIPYACVSVAGWYGLNHLLSPLGSWGKNITGGVILLILLYPQINKFIEMKSDFLGHPLWSNPYYKDLLQADEWIKRNTPENILVASNEDQQGYFMHRPFISTPPGRAFTCENLNLFNSIYKPDYYLLSADMPERCFAAIPRTAVFSNKTFRINKVVK